jgi:hypothetical protein
MVYRAYPNHESIYVVNDEIEGKPVEAYRDIEDAKFFADYYENTKRHATEIYEISLQ